MRKRSFIKIAILIVLLLCVILITIAARFVGALFHCVYKLDDNNQAVVTQGGEIVGKPKIKIGEYFRVPWFQEVHYFPKHFIQENLSKCVKTRDQHFIELHTYVQWKIIDPMKFLRYHSGDTQRCSEHIRASIMTDQYDLISLHTLKYLVGKIDFRVGFDNLRIDNSVKDLLQNKVAPSFSQKGVEIEVLKMECTWHYDRLPLCQGS